MPGFSTINSHNNTVAGVRVQQGATITLSNQARIIGMQNSTTGLVADNGVGLTLVNSTLRGNTVRPATRVRNARYTCDATVLVRGTSGITCPTSRYWG